MKHYFECIGGAELAGPNSKVANSKVKQTMRFCPSRVKSCYISSKKVVTSARGIAKYGKSSVWWGKLSATTLPSCSHIRRLARHHVEDERYAIEVARIVIARLSLLQEKIKW
eukprot:scaffold1168_cov167-Amphora_coffeaeformis.AAC.21